MTYQQLLEVLQRMPECYLKQQVMYQSFEEQTTINATRVSFFSYEYKDDDPSIP